MALKVRRAGAADYGRYVKALIVGDPGAGKTRSASTWPNVLYANVDGGMMSVTDRQPAVVDIASSVELQELLRTLEQDAPVREKILGVPVETVCIDTIDHFARILVEERLMDQRKETMAIQDWGWLADQLRGVVRGFRNLPMHVLLNCHVKTEEDSDSGKVTYRPAIQGSMGNEIPGYVDLAVLLTARPRTTVKDGKNIREMARVMQTFPDSQHPWIKDRSGKLPMEFAINLEDDFKRMDALVFADLPGEPPAVEGTGEAPPAPEAKAAEQPKTTATKAKAAPAEKVAEKAAEKPAEAAPAAAAAPAAPAEEAAAPEAPAAAEAAPAATEPEAAPAEPEAAAAPTEPEAQPQLDVEAPVAPAPEPEPEPEPEAAATEPAAEETVPADGTPAEPEAASAKPAWQTCGSCGGDVESKDQSDLSFIRFREHLCRKCFAERKKAK